METQTRSSSEAEPGRHCHAWPGAMSRGANNHNRSCQTLLPWRVLHGLQCDYLLLCGPPWAAGEQPSHSSHAEFLPFPKRALTGTAPALLMSSALSSSSGSAGTGSVLYGAAPGLFSQRPPVQPVCCQHLDMDTQHKLTGGPGIPVTNSTVEESRGLFFSGIVTVLYFLNRLKHSTASVDLSYLKTLVFISDVE